MKVKNIYQHKNYKLFPLIPIALLLISLIFIPRIPLDSSLKGGINVQIQTNSSVDIRALTTAINSRIPGAQASISTSPGGISITVATNTSLAGAEQTLLALYGYDGNYTSATYRIASLQFALKNQSSNATLQTALQGAEANQTKALSSMDTATAGMLTGLKPLLNKTYPYNASDPTSMVAAAKSAYTDASSNYKGYIISTLQQLIPFTVYSYNEVTPTLGAYFLSQMVWIIITAFILVAIVVFLLFRTPIPSLSVVFGSGNDILVALGAMGLFGIPLGVASIGGLLMLIGYSIDTDMLSAIRILKRGEDTPSERAFGTMKTGMTMTFAAIISFSILLIISYVTFIPTYFDISSIVLFGLIADLFTTWLGNTPMVLWYKQRKEARMA
jgi:preprotein translocase subunit SecF